MQRFSPQDFETLLTAVPDALLVADEDGRIRYANAHAGELFGDSPEGLRQLEVEDLLPPSLRAQHRDRRKAYLRDPHPLRMGQRRVLQACRRDGTAFPAEVSLQPVRLDGRWFVVSTVRDASARLAQEQVLRRQRDELGRLSQTLAERIQNPTRQVRQYAELIATRYAEALDPAGRECLEALEYAARSMERRLTVLVRYLRLEEERPAHGMVDLEAVLEEVVRRLDFPIEDREASIRLHGPWPTLRGDPSLLVDLFQELLDNALSHGGESPWVVVRVVAEAQGQVEVSVRDNGPGVATTLRERLFLPFERGGGEGLGMGLAVARRIAEVHGGALWLADDGPGADFRVRLPRFS